MHERFDRDDQVDVASPSTAVLLPLFVWAVQEAVTRTLLR